MRSRKKPLRASFIVTFAATMGCAESQVTHNPPRPEPEPPKDLARIEIEQGACVEHTRRFENNQLVDVTPPRKVECPKERVFKRSDGQCYFSFPDPCDHSGCNPPPPQRVDCPPDK